MLGSKNGFVADVDDDVLIPSAYSREMSIPTEKYTHGHHESVLKSHTWRTIANSAAYLEARLAPGLSLLDVGCGPGTITVEFADRLAPGRVVGLDAADAAIAKASEFVRPNLEFLVGSAYELPFDDDAFDIVHTHQTLHHLADPVAALREMRRVAKPGGVVAAREVDYAGTFWFPRLAGLDEWIDLYERVHRSNGGEPDAGTAAEVVGAGGGVLRHRDDGIRLELLGCRRP